MFHSLFLGALFNFLGSQRCPGGSRSFFSFFENRRSAADLGHNQSFKVRLHAENLYLEEKRTTRDKKNLQKRDRDKKSGKKGGGITLKDRREKPA